MALRLKDVRKFLEPEEPNYKKAAEMGAEALPHLVKLIEGANVELAAKAASLAGMIASSNTFEVLRVAAQSSDPRVRVAAVSASRNLEDAERSGLLEMLVMDNDVGVQRAALKCVPGNASSNLQRRVLELARTAGLPDSLQSTVAAIASQFSPSDRYPSSAGIGQAYNIALSMDQPVRDPTIEDLRSQTVVSASSNVSSREVSEFSRPNSVNQPAGASMPIYSLMPGEVSTSSRQSAASSRVSSSLESAIVNRSAFELRDKSDAYALAAPLVHRIGSDRLCETDKRGFATPENRSPLELVVDATDGFIPLWSKGVVLRWRFNEQSMMAFQNVDAAKQGIRNLFAQALTMWGDAAPIGFKEQNDNWDFEIVMRSSDNCSGGGCVLASAFFPDAGRHELFIYPKMFTQSVQEQVETLVHEIGHVFGLRHFFAQISETAWRSEIFGTHSPFSIMNYGANSRLTDVDKSDLKRLYNLVWSGQLTEINGTPIRLFKPFHDSGSVAWPSAVASVAKSY